MSTKQRSRELGKYIGETIAKYRQSKDLTQAQVAEQLNMSNDAISRIERGNIMPTLPRLIQFAELFECEVCDLIEEASPLMQDQSKRFEKLLGQLEESERMELVKLVEQVIQWHLKNRA